MSKLGQHLGTAASGAAVGTAIAPGIGTAIGGGVGLLGSLLRLGNKEPMEMTSGRSPADEAMAQQYRQYLQQQMTQPNLYAPMNDLSMKAANMMSSMYYGEPYEHQGFQPFNPTDVGGQQSFDPIEFPSWQESWRDKLGGYLQGTMGDRSQGAQSMINKYAPRLGVDVGQPQEPGYYKPPTGGGQGPKKMPYAR